MSYTVYHLLGHVHGVYDNSTEVLNAVLTMIPIGKVKQRKLLASLSRLPRGGYTDTEHDGAAVLIKRTK